MRLPLRATPGKASLASMVQMVIAGERFNYQLCETVLAQYEPSLGDRNKIGVMVLTWMAQFQVLYSLEYSIGIDSISVLRYYIVQQ